MPPGPRSPTAPASVRATEPTCISTLTSVARTASAIEGCVDSSANDESTMHPDPNEQGDLTMRLSDAGLRRHQTKLLYPNHRSAPWLTEDAAPRSLEPIVRR